MLALRACSVMQHAAIPKVKIDLNLRIMSLVSILDFVCLVRKVNIYYMFLQAKCVKAFRLIGEKCVVASYSFFCIMASRWCVHCGDVYINKETSYHF